MMATLDPYTVYIPEADIEDVRIMTEGQYGGIGSLIHYRDGAVYISEPYEGFPADKAGLKPGDKILEVNGESTQGKNTADVSAMLKGQAGTTLTLLMERRGVAKPFEVTLTRQEIQIKNVTYYGMLRDSVGYIRQDGFTEGASKEVKEAFLDLKRQGMKYLVFDLRYNGGGLLSEAVDELKQTADNLVDADDFSSNLKDSLALYYTFTFYDSVSYLRYDASTDEEALGDPYGSYEQSAYAEQIAWLRYDDTKGAQTGAPAHSIFIDYTATDVTVEADQLTSDDSDDEETTEPAGDVNVAMIISSGILAAVLIVAIVLIVARRFGKLLGKKKKAAPVNKTHGRPAPKPIVKAAPPEEAPKDENDPYNE